MASKKGEVIIPENVRSIVTKYILHFNIDNTLLMPESNNQNREEQVISIFTLINLQLIQILVHFAWGKVDDKNKFKLS